MNLFLVTLLISAAALASCPSRTVSQISHIKSEKISEASGMEFSRIHKDVMYVHNDSGEAPVIFALDLSGRKMAEFSVMSPVNDWEDISLGKCLDSVGDCLYLADTGNKKGKRQNLEILMIEEPKVLQNAVLEVKKVISFESQGQNFESLAFDEKRTEFYLLNKRGRRFDPIDANKGLVTLFSLKPSESVLQPKAQFDFTKIPGLMAQDTLVTSADFDPASDSLLIGTYGKAFEINVSDFSNFTGAVSVHSFSPLLKAEASAYNGTDIFMTSEGKNPPILKLSCSP